MRDTPYQKVIDFIQSVSGLSDPMTREDWNQLREMIEEYGKDSFRQGYEIGSEEMASK